MKEKVVTLEKNGTRRPIMPKKMEAKPAAREKRMKKCSEAGCDQPQTTNEFCRMHYIKNWREIVRERREKAREKLTRYVENVTEKYPDDFNDILESDFADEETLKKRLHEFGFKEEFEEGAKNPFGATDVKDLMDDMDLEEEP